MFDREAMRREADDYRVPKRCPKCDSERLIIESDAAGYCVVCEDCLVAWGPCWKKPSLMIEI